MSDSPGRSPEWWHGEGYAHLDRDLWETVLAALRCEDRAVRLEVGDAVLAVGSPAWDVDLDVPEVLEERLSRFEGSPRGAGVLAEVARLRWSHTRPQITPDPGG